MQNINLLAQIEYKTIVQERTRLAREIHDGLAQTLGFLKLKVAQMKSYLRDGEIEVASQTVDILYDTLADAYQDARQAIDGLRILPSEEGLAGWLRQTASEFEETSGIPVHCHGAGRRHRPAAGSARAAHPHRPGGFEQYPQACQRWQGPDLLPGVCRRDYPGGAR